VILAAGIEPTLDLGGFATGVVYLVVIGFVFVESGILLGFFLPGDSILFAAGLLAARPDSDVSVHVLVVGVTAAAVLGDAVGYLTGRRLGRPWLERRPRMRGHVARAEAFYDRHGALAVVAARWFPWIRTATPVVAGIARMPYRRFLVANVVGALSWGAGLVLLGYFAYEVPWLRRAAIGVAAASILAAIVVGVVRRMRRRRAGRRGDPQVDHSGEAPTRTPGR
jgi:membrane-associated protein